MIKLIGICKTYNIGKRNAKQVINNFNFDFPDKGLVGIVGHSGTGKTTLINLISLIDTSDSGVIKYNEDDISSYSESQKSDFRKDHISVQFQDYNLFLNMTAFENLQFFSKFYQIDNYEVKIKEINDKLKIDDLMKSKMKSLSGGEQARLAIARTLLSNREIMLFDEPSGNLDEENEDIVFGLLKDYSKDHLIIVVSHNVVKLNTLTDIIINLDNKSK